MAVALPCLAPGRSTRRAVSGSCPRREGCRWQPLEKEKPSATFRSSEWKTLVLGHRNSLAAVLKLLQHLLVVGKLQHQLYLKARPCTALEWFGNTGGEESNSRILSFRPSSGAFRGSPSKRPARRTCKRVHGLAKKSSRSLSSMKPVSMWKKYVVHLIPKLPLTSRIKRKTRQTKPHVFSWHSIGCRFDAGVALQGRNVELKVLQLHLLCPNLIEKLLLQTIEGHREIDHRDLSLPGPTSLTTFCSKNLALVP